ADKGKEQRREKNGGRGTGKGSPGSCTGGALVFGGPPPPPQKRKSRRAWQTPAPRRPGGTARRRPPAGFPSPFARLALQPSPVCPFPGLTLANLPAGLARVCPNLAHNLASIFSMGVVPGTQGSCGPRSPQQRRGQGRRAWATAGRVGGWPLSFRAVAMPTGADKQGFVGANSSRPPEAAKASADAPRPPSQKIASASR